MKLSNVAYWYKRNRLHSASRTHVDVAVKRWESATGDPDLIDVLGRPKHYDTKLRSHISGLSEQSARMIVRTIKSLFFFAYATKTIDRLPKWK